MKTYGFNAVKLSDAYTLQELAALREEVQGKHRLPKPDGIWLYDKAGRRKLDALAWAVRYRMQENQSSQGASP